MSLLLLFRPSAEEAAAPDTGACYLLSEDGTALLAEDGSHLLRDDCVPATGGTSGTDRRRRVLIIQLPNDDEEVLLFATPGRR